MKQALKSILIWALIFSAAPAHAATEDPLLKIPDGYQAGRSDATYGTYSSVMSEPARALQARSGFLENKIMGFARLADQDRVKQAETLFVLEQAVLKLNFDIANSDRRLTEFERSALLFQSAHLYKALRHFGERVFEDMVRFIDVQIPGPNGLQFRSELSGTLESIYLPNYRSEKPLSTAERELLYRGKRKEFEDAGHSLTEIKKLTPEFLGGLGPYTRVEYVLLESGEIRVTEGRAGHVLLAEGGAVKAAGQFIFLKDRNGRFTLAVISNASGNFKPDLFSLVPVSKTIEQLTKISAEQIVLTKGEPLSMQAIKVYSKGMKLPKELTTERLARLEEMEKSLQNRPDPAMQRSGLTCKALFQ